MGKAKKENEMAIRIRATAEELGDPFKSDQITVRLEPALDCDGDGHGEVPTEEGGE